MKTLTIILLLTAFSASGQSFYHKRMKKVKRKSEIGNCQAVQPATPISTRVNSKILYTRKRAEYRKRRI